MPPAATRNDWLSTVRGRLSYAAGRFMPCITGAATFGNLKTSIAGVGSSNDSKGCWTLGGSVEAAIARPWTVKVEYLYVDLGNGGAVAGSTASFLTNLVRVGVNYRF